jgi:hypothetical protein
MKFLIVAMMTLINTESGTRDLYVFDSHKFDTWNQCARFSQINAFPIMRRLFEEFGPDNKPHMVSCVTEDVVKQLIQELEIIT